MCVFESVLSASKCLLWSQQLQWFSEINLKSLPGGSRCLPGINLTFHLLDLIVDNVKENSLILRTKRSPAIAGIKFFCFPQNCPHSNITQRTIGEPCVDEVLVVVVTTIAQSITRELQGK